MGPFSVECNVIREVAKQATYGTHLLTNLPLSLTIAIGDHLSLTSLEDDAIVVFSLR